MSGSPAGALAPYRPSLWLTVDPSLSPSLPFGGIISVFPGLCKEDSSGAAAGRALYRFDISGYNWRRINRFSGPAARIDKESAMQIRAVCLFLSLWCMLFSAHACASAAEVLTSAELEEACRAMLDAAIASGSVRQPDAQENPETDGYRFDWNGNALFMHSPARLEQNRLRGALCTRAESLQVRGIACGSTLDEVLRAFGTARPSPDAGMYCLLYCEDDLPYGAWWARAESDGADIRAVQFAVHETMAEGVYTDCGLVFTLEEGRVSSIRVYGMDAFVELEGVTATLRLVLSQSVYAEPAPYPDPFQPGTMLTGPQHDS